MPKGFPLIFDNIIFRNPDQLVNFLEQNKNKPDLVSPIISDIKILISIGAIDETMFTKIEKDK